MRLIESAGVLRVCCLIGAFGTVACSKAADTVEEQVSPVVGATSVELDSRDTTVYVQETRLGNFIADVIRAELATMNKEVEVSIFNSGGIRGGVVDENGETTSDGARIGKLYPVGPLTELDVEGWTPFPDDFHLITLTGTQLKSVLERGVSSLPPDIRVLGEGGWFLQVSGMKYRYICEGTPQKLDTTATAIQTEGSRIVFIQVGSNVIFDSASNINLLSATSVRVSANGFLASGGDGHVELTRGTNIEVIKQADFNLPELLKAAVKAKSPISPAIEGRITGGSCT